MNDTLSLLGLATTPLELISFVLAVITVVLNIRQTHWAWLFAIVSSATYAVVFFDARLYGDMGLQGVFIAVSVWGWYQWLHGSAAQAQSPLVVTRASAALWRYGIAFWLLAFALLAWFLATFTNTDVPYIDGFLTAGSLLGQVLLSRKKVENWTVWIVVDVLYVGLYIHKDLYLTAVLYAVFVVLAAIGLRTWSRLADAKAPA